MSLRPRRWGDLSRVERVGRYTRLSLLGVLWLLVSLAVLPVLDEVSSARAAALVLGTVVVTGLGSWALDRSVVAHPDVRVPWRRVAPLAVAAAVLVVAVGLTGGTDVRAAVVAVAAVNVVAALASVPDLRVSAVLVVTTTAAYGLLLGGLTTVLGGAYLAAAVVFSVRVSLWLYGVVAELDDARRAQSRLAVAEERLRFSRDVHDVLGRRLATIAVQAELAATLAARGDESAAARMLEVRAVAHDALTEARELARGYRPTDLATELEGARSLLRSAGIEVRLDVGVVPRGWHEVAGWVVRETVTNVLRHSRAREVVISYADEALVVTNDGSASGVGSVDEVGEVGDAAEGGGLRGLRERLGALGATLEVESDGDRWRVVTRLPGSGPLSATAAREAVS